VVGYTGMQSFKTDDGKVVPYARVMVRAEGETEVITFKCEPSLEFSLDSDVELGFRVSPKGEVKVVTVA